MPVLNSLNIKTDPKRVNLMKHMEEAIRKTKEVVQLDDLMAPHADDIRRDTGENEEGLESKLMTYRSSDSKEGPKEDEPLQQTQQRSENPRGGNGMPISRGHRRPGTEYVEASKVPQQFQVRRVPRPNFPAHILRDLERIKREQQNASQNKQPTNLKGI